MQVDFEVAHCRYNEAIHSVPGFRFEGRAQFSTLRSKVIQCYRRPARWSFVASSNTSTQFFIVKRRCFFQLTYSSFH